MPADSVATRAVTPAPLTARLEVVPNPSCTGIATGFDARASSGPDPIVRYRFEYEEYVRPPSTFDQVVISNGPQALVQKTFTWNRPSYRLPASSVSAGDIDDYYEWLQRPTYLRDDIIVALTVTDAKGATAKASTELDFVQHLSDEPRDGCPHAFVKPTLGIAFLTSALAGVRTTPTAVNTTFRCASAVACVGTLTVAGFSTRGGAARGKAIRPPIYASKVFSVPGRSRRTVTARLTKPTRKALRKAGRLRAQVSFSAAGASGRAVTRSKRIALRSTKRGHGRRRSQAG
jgi:hypothetical protein